MERTLHFSANERSLIATFTAFSRFSAPLESSWNWLEATLWAWLFARFWEKGIGREEAGGAIGTPDERSAVRSYSCAWAKLGTSYFTSQLNAEMSCRYFSYNGCDDSFVH